jgi:hypothetical protein
MGDEPVMRYYDAAGKLVKEGDASSVVQYLSDDPNRPDATAGQGTPAEVATPSLSDMAPKRRVAAPRRTART